MSFLRKRSGADRREPTVTGAKSAHPLSVALRTETREDETPRGGEPADMANIGKSISIKGDVTGDEDTVIEGRVEGRVELSNHHLTVGPNGDVKGEISAKQVTVVGKVAGNITATERIELSDSGRVDGDLLSPRLLVQEGAQLNGEVSMKPVAAPLAKPAEPPKKLEGVAQQRSA